MEKDEHIVRYTAEEIDAMIERGEDQSDFERVASLTEEELEASIDIEEEGVPDWSTIYVGLPPTKHQVTLRLDPIVLDHFKAEGPGYQTRINAVLRSYVEAQQKKAS